MGRVNSEAAALLVAGICRGKFWASPEETERWLKTETGQRIAALAISEHVANLLATIENSDTYAFDGFCITPTATSGTSDSFTVSAATNKEDV